MKDLPDVAVGPLNGRESLFPWRGIMLDSARTAHTVSTIKHVITLAARYGFNRLHWHLTDDQGWRFNVPAYPKLGTVSADLPRGQFDAYDSLNPGTWEQARDEAPTKWTNGVYTDADIADIVAHADANGLDIVPEVDLPGHMMAAIEAYPELGRPAGLPLPTESMRPHMWWPARNDLLWPTDEARAFVRAVLLRVTELFPGSYVHIGGDECAYRQWASDPEMDAWLHKRNVPKVSDLQAWFMDDALRILREAGRHVVAWDEACDISNDQDVLVIAWDEDRGMDRVSRTGHQYVFSDARTLYLNRVDPEASKPQKGMLPGISVDDILTAPWAEAQSAQCRGIQACAWSEFILDADDLMSMLFPRLLAVSERMWNPDTDPVDARQRVFHEYEMLQQAGMLAADPVW